jgi:hypothetical protein
MNINVYAIKLDGTGVEFNFKGHEMIHGHQFEKDGLTLKIKPSAKEGCDADFWIYEGVRLLGRIPFKISPWAETQEETL